MRAVVTGARGTVGRALMQQLQAAGHTPIAWDRAAVLIDNYAAMEAYLRREKADAVFHLAIASKPTGRANEGWLVDWHWPSELAWLTRQLRIPFVFTSTVLVYTNNVPGPITPATEPDAAEGYGLGKRRAELRIHEQNPDARIARLGWQIGDAPGTNNMIDFLAKQPVVRASTRWLPACSLVADTADALIRIAALDPGTYLVDSNRDMNFFEVANALNKRHGGNWRIEPSDDFTLDQRMVDERVAMPSLRERLA